MGRIRKQPPVKLLTGFIFKEESTLNKAEGILKRHFGKIDFESQVLAFTHTSYYEPEFGKNLKRKFIGFKYLVHPQDLPKIKIITNSVEDKLSRRGLRLINIDPGYLDMAKLVLASTKDYKHRIYLGKGIYAEIALFYQNKSFTPWEWTYPDYRSTDYAAIFNHIRDIYAEQIKKIALGDNLKRFSQ